MQDNSDPNSLYPVSQPLFTLKELLEWTPGGAAQNPSRTSLFLKHHNRRKLLICHDMKGGYLEDRFIQGVSETDCFRFHHWWKVDTFVYFSHHFVTLPPSCWIDAGHRHGVKILGTFITEWEAGRKVCEEFLKDKTMLRKTADQLVHLARHYRFEGWLINIENELQEEQASMLQEFLSYLTKEMHLHVANSEVIWYDSVTREGKLDWQNELNEKNSCFFEACDGIFLNYTWKESNLRASANLAQKLNRLNDVYVGIDVYGRGCFGGGGFKTNMAIEVASACDLSAAIFGIGWTHEKLEPGEDFVDRDERYWNLLQNFCPKRKVLNLPLVTWFCQGWGKKYYCRGQVMSDIPWTSLSLQQVQPTDSEETSSMKYTTADGYFGGGCLEITRRNKLSKIRVFSLDVSVMDDLFICYTYKTITPGRFMVQLTLLSSGDARSLHYNLPSDECFSDDSTVVEQCASAIGDTHDDVTVKPSHVRSTARDDGSIWMTRKFCLSGMKDHRLTEISIVFSSNSEDCAFRLGELKVFSQSALCKRVNDQLKSFKECKGAVKCLSLKKNSFLASDNEEINSDQKILENSESDHTPHCLSETENPEGLPVYSVEDNKRIKLDKENILQHSSSVQPLPNIRLHLKLTWEINEDILQQISHFLVSVWSRERQKWQCLGHTPICSYSFSFDKESNDFDLSRFKLDAVLINGKIVSDIDVKMN